MYGISDLGISDQNGQFRYFRLETPETKSSCNSQSGRMMSENHGYEIHSVGIIFHLAVPDQAPYSYIKFNIAFIRACQTRPIAITYNHSYATACGFRWKYAVVRFGKFAIFHFCSSKTMHCEFLCWLCFFYYLLYINSSLLAFLRIKNGENWSQMKSECWIFCSE